MFGKKKGKANSKEEYSSHYSLRLERRKKTTPANNYSAEYLCKNSSSSESLDNLISSYRLKGRKGFSLDRSFDVEPKSQAKPKRSSWFLRDKSREKQSKSEKFLKRSSLDFTVTYDTKQTDRARSKQKPIQRQNAADYTGDSSATPQEDFSEPKKGLSKFQIGKRFLKGEIGIRSFNYYLLKEGLKKNQTKTKSDTKPSYKSKSEENIYEEIYFRSDLPTPKPRTPPALPPFNKQPAVIAKESCLDCEICLQEAQEKVLSCPETHQHQPAVMLAEGYAQVARKISEKSIYDFFQQQQPTGPTVLQFQSYNPSNPTVYKLETTPVAFEYTPIEEQIYQLEFARAQQHFSGDGKIMAKSPSLSDSLKGHNQRQRQQQMQQQSTEFYTRPNFSLPPTTKKDARMYKTDSSNSIRSEDIYNSKNSSQRSSNHNREDVQLRQDMSDSSLGDSLFSSDANKRYFGSSESCRFNYECGRRRCSLENDKCSFSDTCRYECNLRNCDCSSSYFSSDFDDTNGYNTTNKAHMKSRQPPLSGYDTQTRASQYAEDFIKHVSNVKRRSQNIPFDGNNTLIMGASIYETPKSNPKRLEGEPADDEKMLQHGEKASRTEREQGKATGTVPKLSSSSNNSKKKKSGQRLERENKPKDAKESESLPRVKPPPQDEKRTQRDEKPRPAETSPEAIEKSPKSDNSKDPVGESEQRQLQDEDDDDVFLESKQTETFKEGEANEAKNVSVIRD